MAAPTRMARMALSAVFVMAFVSLAAAATAVSVLKELKQRSYAVCLLDLAQQNASMANENHIPWLNRIRWASEKLQAIVYNPEGPRPPPLPPLPRTPGKTSPHRHSYSHPPPLPQKPPPSPPPSKSPPPPSVSRRWPPCMPPALRRQGGTYVPVGRPEHACGGTAHLLTVYS